MLAHARTRLLDRLPDVRGEIAENASLDAITWFRTGGPAEVLFQPADIDDLTVFTAGLHPDINVTVLGLGSNVLIRDGGVPGVVIHLGKKFAEIAFNGDTVVAGAGALDVAVSRACRDQGLAGLEFLNGIPGTVGGALRMNAGAYGREMSDILISASALDRSGTVRDINVVDFGYTYRQSTLDDDLVFLSARLRGTPGDAAEIDARMSKISENRKSSQPIQENSGGSMFKNPAGAKAWELIDAAGCRGLSIGDAAVSEQHCNFLINRGNASAHDLEILGEEVRRRVEQHAGVRLEWEIRRIGLPEERPS